MKLRNKSIWNAGDLRKFLVVCFEKAGVKHKGYLIEVVNRCRGKYWIKGLGSYTQKWIKLLLPISHGYTGSDGRTDYRDITELNLETLAQVTVHEIDHTRGLHHRDMIDLRSIGCEWTKDYKVRKGEINV